MQPSSSRLRAWSSLARSARARWRWRARWRRAGPVPETGPANDHRQHRRSDLPAILAAMAENTGRAQESRCRGMGGRGRLFAHHRRHGRGARPDPCDDAARSSGRAGLRASPPLSWRRSTASASPTSSRCRSAPGSNILAEERERERHLILQGLMLLKQGKSGILIRQTMQNLLVPDKKKKPEEVQADGAGGRRPGGGGLIHAARSKSEKEGEPRTLAR